MSVDVPRAPYLVQNDAYPDLPVHLKYETYTGERTTKGNGTHGHDMCLARIETRRDNQGEKPLQAYTRSIYWSAIRPSITSRYTSSDSLFKKTRSCSFLF